MIMNRQLSLDSFFKSKSTVPIDCPKSIMNCDKNNVIKKRTLSLKKQVVPSKSPKVNFKDKNESDAIINLCSDDEYGSPSSSNTNGTPIKSNEETSNSSQATLIYSLTPTTPQDIVLSPQTPCTEPLTPSSTSLKIRSPSSINKYFSPSKKRVLFKKTPVKRKLNYQHKSDQTSASGENDDSFHESCEGLDDKTIFLLKIINKCLKNESLKCLLNEYSQNLLKNYKYIVKPGMELVCRLFWYKQEWYKEEKLRLILSKKKECFEETQFQQVLKSLLDFGFITSNVSSDNTTMTFEDFIMVLDRNDLKVISKQLKLNNNTKKGAVEALRNYSKSSSISNFFTGNTGNNLNRVLEIMSTKAGNCYKLSQLMQRTLYRLYVLMYLGIDYTLIREKKLELMLIFDKIKRETYPIEDDLMLDNASVVFKNNDDFERYIKALTIYDDFIKDINVNKKCDVVVSVFNVYKNYTEEEILRYTSLPTWLRRFTPLNLYVRIMEEGIQDLKKECKTELTLDILSTLISQDVFRQHKKADWYAEKALVLHKDNRYDEAAKVLLEGFKSNLTEEAKDVMRVRAKKVATQTSQDDLKRELLAYADNNVLEKNLRGKHVHKQPME